MISKMHIHYKSEQIKQWTVLQEIIDDHHWKIQVFTLFWNVHYKNRAYLIKLMNLLLKRHGRVNKFSRWKKMMKVGKC